MKLQKEGHLQLTDLPGYGYAEVPLAEQKNGVNDKQLL
jgi:GTP-binding protein EngB required for normal cell division